MVYIKKINYDIVYSDIPRDYIDRLAYMFDKYNISDKKAKDILNMRNNILMNYEYFHIDLNLYEIPEGDKRPRYRISKSNYNKAGIDMPMFVHVYSPGARQAHERMRLNVQQLLQLDSLICTPCVVNYKVFMETPSSYSVERKFLAEIGLDRPLITPDWDNFGKRYSDMTNHNIWLDDKLVIDGRVQKFYSILPRIEISLDYLNTVYNKIQYRNITKSKIYNDLNCKLNEPIV